jgi:hypothetical protein
MGHFKMFNSITLIIEMAASSLLLWTRQSWALLESEMLPGTLGPPEIKLTL